MLAGALKWRWADRHEKGWCCVDNVYRDLDRAVAKRVQSGSPLAGVYAFEDGAADLFAAARSRSIPTVYDLPIGYWRAGRRIQMEERERQPEWAGTMQALVDSEPKLARKDDELARADLVLVASSFTAETLREAPHRFPRGNASRRAAEGALRGRSEPAEGPELPAGGGGKTRDGG